MVLWWALRRANMNPCVIRLVWLLSVTLVLVAGTTVIINNNLKNRKDLTIHCKSKDDDLGVHVLSYGESYDFEFEPDIFWRTLFFCRMTWNGKSHWYDVYDEYVERLYGDSGGCLQIEDDKCVWNVIEFGLCTPKTADCYPWNR
ncbi:S-protein homolog 2-like [Hibiscus syriacus]|uniref:S-protein homolog 2-like n=1 Tax=Hibiscus syriacus TaxID=106335 RepID=UPI0019204CE5|nr:S-protein homolog 2-like [Hibiscus syriacus]